MIQLPAPCPDAYWVLIYNPVFRFPFGRRDLLLAGEILSRCACRSELGAGLSSEARHRWDEWMEEVQYEPESELEEADGGYVRAPHNSLGFSFSSFWVVPPTAEVVAEHLMTRCREHPWLIRDWDETSIGLPSLSTDYLDFMVPFYANNDEHDDGQFFSDVHAALEEKMTTWKTEHDKSSG